MHSKILKCDMKKLTLFKAIVYKSNESKSNIQESIICNRPIYVEILENEYSTKSKFKIIGLSPSFSIIREFEFSNRKYCDVGYKYMYYYSIPFETYNYDYFVKLQSREKPTISKFTFNQPYEAVLYEDAGSRITSIAFTLFNGERKISIEVDANQNNMAVDIDILITANEILNAIEVGIPKKIEIYNFSEFHEANIKASSDLINSILGFDYLRVGTGEVVLSDSDIVWLDILYEVQSFVQSHVKNYDDFENEF